MIGLARTFAVSFKKWPDRLPKAATLDTLVFFKRLKMVFLETVARLEGSLWVMPLLCWKTGFKVNLFGGLGSFSKRFPARLE